MENAEHTIEFLMGEGRPIYGNARHIFLNSALNKTFTANQPSSTDLHAPNRSNDFFD
jgi:hypothetical protein